MAVSVTAIAHVHAHLGLQLREYYSQDVEIDASSRLGRVLGRLSAALDAAEAGHEVPAAFKDDLIGMVPRLRRYALSLTRDAVEADDLVQFTLLRAWQHRTKFTSGTNLVAWLFAILRNGFINGRRKHRLEVPDPDGIHAAALVRPADQEHKLDIRDLQAALDRLEPTYREALLLVAVEGLSYEAAADAIGCPTGTVKSRVSRARDWLARDLGEA